MPIYGYACTTCGPFEDFRPMADYDKPASCPSCGRSSPRRAAAAQLNLMAGNNRKAHSLNEKNSSEPRVARAKTHAGHHGHDHRHGHHHHGHGHHGHQHAGADRPWMVGH
jgi:putative FmdB family regulatory protein